MESCHSVIYQVLMWTIFSAQVMRSTDLQLQSLRNDVIWESILLGLFCDVACLARACAFCQAPLLKLWTLLSWGEIWNWSRCKKSSPWTTHHDPIKNSPFTAHHSKVGQNKTGTSENVEKNSSNWRGVFWLFADFIFLFFENGDGELLLDMRLQFVIEEWWRRTVFFWLCLVLVIMMMIMEVARYFDGSGKNPTQFSPFDLK